MAECPTCAGTKQIVLMKSWFHTDGYRRERCHSCGGTGEVSASSRTLFLQWGAEQAKMRQRYDEWRGETQ